MGQGGFSAAGKPGKPEQGTPVAVEAVTVGLFDAALEWEYVVFWHGFHGLRCYWFKLQRSRRI